ncbi:MAG: hypothetical protein AB1938_10985 [Myxococcota bacterium]
MTISLPHRREVIDGPSGAAPTGRPTRRATLIVFFARGIERQ